MTPIDVPIPQAKPYEGLNAGDYGKEVGTGFTEADGTHIAVMQTSNGIMEVNTKTGLPYGTGLFGAMFGIPDAPTTPAPSTPDASQSQQNGSNGTYGDGTSTSGGADPAGPNNDHVSNPIILDLSGNGINITQLSQSNVFMDSSGSGYKSQTAWAGVGNGVLFYDPSGQGVLTQANQYIFTDWDPSASTDLQALEDVFDTNHDGELDTNDSNYGDFFVMETNADGTETAHSLTSLNITSIDLNANSYQSTLPDGSGINGETTYTVTTTTGISNKNSSPTTTTTQYTAASVTLATGAAGYAVASTTTQNADGTTTIDNVAKNGDGSVAYSRVLNTAVTGGTTTKTLADLNGGGVVTSIETDTTTTPATNTTVETVVNYLGGSVNAAGEIVTSGERLNATTLSETDGASTTLAVRETSTETTALVSTKHVLERRIAVRRRHLVRRLAA